MLDAFEARLADVVADLLAGLDAVQLVTRPRGDLAAQASARDKIAIVVQVLSGAADGRLGDDARERLGVRGAYRLRAVLHLAGQAAVDLCIRGTGGTGVQRRRETLVRTVDEVLARLHAEAIRTGRAFATGADQGFELDGFRLADVGPVPDETKEFTILRARYDYRGRFWPVEPAAEGDLIDALPTRLAILPAGLPDHVRAVAGGPDVDIPLRLDLRELGGAPARVAARLLGASAPGALLGEAAGVPAGWVGFDVAGDGVVHVTYRPPASVAAAVRVRAAVALSRAEGPPLGIAQLAIEVTA